MPAWDGCGAVLSQLVQCWDRPVFADDELCIATVINPCFKCITFDLLAMAAVVDVCVVNL